MNFHDLGIIVAKRTHTEHAHVLIVLTAEHGLYHGLVRSNKTNRAYCEPGVIHKVTWQARLSEHLGTWIIDPLLNTLPAVLSNSFYLCALNSACDLLAICLNERETCPNLYACFSNLLVNIMEHSDDVRASYCLLECELVRTLGLPLSFNKCAVTGQEVNLNYVSPRSGRAVSSQGAQGYEERLLRLPNFLAYPDNHAQPSKSDILDALKISEHFLNRYVLDIHHKKMPLSRSRLIMALQELN